MMWNLAILRKQPTMDLKFRKRYDLEKETGVPGPEVVVKVTDLDEIKQGE